ncbi:hypothetical protein O3M35_004951 [Rhynocoris fuscipes]|uniref:Integrase zinc-binding domain-containing protein n=1 Tax=Rhynocoris fuscipes TaxID=488301 RepID=A0AAW1DJ50_9HEMI
MEVEADPNLLVVNLDHCVSSETRQFGKSSCIYTTTMPPNTCGHDVLQLTTPVQCLGDINQPLSRIQHQHLTQLQPLQYPQVQVSYDNGTLQQPNGSLLAGGAPLYQPPPPTALHHYHPPPPGPPVSAPPTQTYHGGYLTPLSVAPTPSMPDYPPIMPAPTQNLSENVPSQCTEASPSFDHSTVASSSLEKPKTIEIVEPEPLPSDDYQYYKEIERLLATNELPSNTSPVYNKRLRKRAQNYILIGGVLHHNPKEPRRVIMTKEEQSMLLESYHISASSGVHIGIKKMFAKLRDEFFWRGMYVSVATYVRKCTRCSDSASIPIPPVISNNSHQEDSCSQTSGISTGVQTASRIWTDVEIQLCGPYKTTNNRNSHIAVIVDPESKFLLAAALPSSGLATRLTQFMMTNLFSFGFARAHLVISLELYSAVHDEFSRRTRDLRDCHGLLRRREKPICGWVDSLLAHLVDKKPHRWDRELDKFLYQFRTGEMKHFVRICASDDDYIGTVCPFYSMFQRPPCPLSATAASEDKENSFPISSCKTKFKRKREISKTVLCQQSADSMMPKRISAPSQKETISNNHEIACGKQDDSLSKQVNDPHKNGVETTKEADTLEPVHMAVTSIKSYLAETRMARQRRGNYNKYPDELRERMASYALKHGSQEAAKHFSTVLGIQVNDSTIRNLVKSRTRFGLTQRQEIAKYAIEKGIAEAAKHFSSTLNVTVSHYLIRRFISLYGPKRPHCKKNRNKMKKDTECLTAKVKNDIGNYANEHSIEETISHFRNLLGIHLMESAVKKLHEDYLQKHPSASHSQNDQRFVKQETAVTSFNEQNTVCCYSQADTNVGSQNSYYGNVQLYQPQYPAGTCPGRPPENVVGETRNSAVSQPFLLVPQENSSTFDLGLQEKVVKTNWVNNSNDEGGSVYQQYPSVNEQIFVEVVSDKSKINNVQNSEQISTTTEHQENQSEKVPKKTVAIKKRGKYSTFSPELRAEIGKYAVEHGCLKASHHFSSIIGRDLPESTARGIKEKYLKKLKYTEVTSLGYSPRGRAPRLGKYDEIVQDCLKELIKTGERASSFLAIITAKKILNKYEPNLLKENGGNVELNNSWAKSFLKRLGLRNNS